LFIDDFEAPRMLFGVTIRSPVASGYVKSIETPKLSGTYTLIRSSDIPGSKQLAAMTVPVLAGEQVGYIGEPVGILVGPDKAKVEDYAAACNVIVEEADSAGEILFEQRELTIGLPAKKNLFENEENETEGKQKIIIEGVYKTGIQDHWSSESAGAVAVYSKGGIKIHTATQWPAHVRDSVAAMLGLPRESISVEPYPLGVHFDAKVWYPSLVSCHAALAAQVMKKAVKIMLTREEHFRYAPKRNAAEIHITSEIGEKGQVSATAIEVRTDMGAHGVFAAEILDRTSLAATGVYKLGAVSLHGKAVRSNNPPAGPFCGFGLSQGFFAIEKHVSAIASALREDGAEWRKNNLLGKYRFINQEDVVSGDIHFGDVLDAACKNSDYKRKWAANELLRRKEPAPEEKITPLRGIGIALAYQGRGVFQPSPQPSYAAAVVEVEIDQVDWMPRIRGIWLAVNAGKIADEERVRRSLTISAIAALGWATTEKIAYVKGIVTEGGVIAEGGIIAQSCAEYGIPSPETIPPLRIELVQTADTQPLDVEELPFSTIPAAYIEAVTQAAGHPFTQIPFNNIALWQVETGKEKEAEEK
jgi:CO/xanthine dehydrogenase Mo-binding subunit